MSAQDSVWFQIAKLEQERVRQLHEAKDQWAEQVIMWRDLANKLGTLLGEALYSDEWDTREYAIAAFADWENRHGAHLYCWEVEPQPVWWFRNGLET